MALAGPSAVVVVDPSTVSNMGTVDDSVRRYVELLHKKTQLLAEVHGLQAELTALKAPLIEHFLQTQHTVPLCPSAAEERLYGAMGALQLKLRNDYEILTRDALVRLCSAFYQYLLPDSNEEEVARLGQGTASWMWNNRKRTPVRYLERSFAVKPPPRAHKRKAAGAAAAAPSAPKVPRARFQPVDNMPHTRDDFLAIPSLDRMLASGSNAAAAAAMDESLDPEDGADGGSEGERAED